MNVTNVQVGLSEVLETGKGMLHCQNSSNTATQSLLPTHHFNIVGIKSSLYALVLQDFSDVPMFSFPVEFEFGKL